MDQISLARSVPALVATAFATCHLPPDFRVDMSAPHAKLIATGSASSRREILLFDFPSRLGRSPAADVHIDDRWVSRDHCEIDVEDHGLTGRALGSKHGTYVNGRPVTRVELHPGDELSVGLSRFVVEFDHDCDAAEVGHEAYA